LHGEITVSISVKGGEVRTVYIALTDIKRMVIPSHTKNKKRSMGNTYGSTSEYYHKHEPGKSSELTNAIKTSRGFRCRHEVLLSIHKQKKPC
jgi:hypothetical protein